MFSRMRRTKVEMSINLTVQSDVLCFFSYRASDHTHVLGVLLEPVVHVLTHSKQVVKARGLSGWPIAFRHLKRELRDDDVKQKMLE